MTEPGKDDAGNGNPPANPNSSLQGPLKYIDSFVQVLTKILGSLTWPTIALIAIIIFYAPVNRVINMLPDKVYQANEINIPSIISIKLAEKVKGTGSEELAKATEGLSKEAIASILKIGDSSNSVISHGTSRDGAIIYSISSSYPVWVELEDKQLLNSTDTAFVGLSQFKKYFDDIDSADGTKDLVISADSLTQEQRDKLLNNRVQLTDAGKQTYEIILEVITGQR